MGFFDRVRALFGRDAAPLVATPRDPRVVEARSLEVHTANVNPDTDEIIVIITLDVDAFHELSLIDVPLRLTSPTSRPVTFVTGINEGAPTLDPNYGWIIPVTQATRDELHALPPGPGEHELATIHVGLIVLE